MTPAVLRAIGCLLLLSPRAQKVAAAFLERLVREQLAARKARR